MYHIFYFTDYWKIDSVYIIFTSSNLIRQCNTAISLDKTTLSYTIFHYSFRSKA